MSMSMDIHNFPKQVSYRGRVQPGSDSENNYVDKM